MSNEIEPGDIIQCVRACEPLNELEFYVCESVTTEFDQDGIRIHIKGQPEGAGYFADRFILVHKKPIIKPIHEMGKW